MKQIILVTILMAFTSGFVFSQTKANQNDKVAQELMQLERDWITASLKRDKAWLERFFADELIVTHPTSGTIKNKSQEIADTIDPAMTADSMTLGEMQVRVIGKVAVVTGSASETGGGGHLTDRNRSYLFTDTFLKRDGRWQLLASHSSRTNCQPSSK
jgi:ketosteroid isomerase-like protein